MTVLVWLSRQLILYRYVAAQFFHSVCGMCREMANFYVGEGTPKIVQAPLLMNH